MKALIIEYMVNIGAKQLAIAFVFLVLLAGIVINLFADLSKRETLKTRQEKRNLKIEIDGKWVNVLKHMQEIATTLPALYHRRTGKKINHYIEMKRLYMKTGNITAVNKYISSVCARAEKIAKSQGVKIVRT